ncbi:ABC transporter permease [Lederbergia wuyishanensis]|uniref:ABC-2 type transport system permease protein n=1 Tax=Lederbergia wuyishanensis TaxID=1347903 RepID=A0ABU0D6N6_9BACI|nr:ABC transporter permease [Lederbergia wuyishanensis]MCJ8008534.1 ABC transporter permease [Lederbergia wuyishanensis]MDQ0344052.1 ABC-2 type transport system permease protein [Lederbergia wuyishanensis]
MADNLTFQTGSLIRFIIRRDRVRIPIWIVSLTAVTFLTAMAFEDLYMTDMDRQAIAETMRNPAMTAMVGKGYGLDHYTNGAMMAHQMLLFTAIIVGLMSILLTARHTRVDEEDGRIELIRSLPVGRLSNLSATVLVLVGTNVLLSILIGFGLYTLRIESMDLNGSLLYGAALGATGIFFTSATTVFAQLAENSRSTIGLSFAVLGVSYLIRAIGDVSNEPLSWFSPLGWILSSEVFVNNYWWPILLTVGAAVVLFILAYYLNAIRDVGAGFLPSKPGKKHASYFLQSPLGLAFRLQRTGIIAWAIGVFVLGASYGSVLGDLESFLENVEMMKEVLASTEGFSLTEQFISMLMSILAMISTIPALMAILKLKGEEGKNRTEHLLSRAVSRSKLLTSYVIVSFGIGFLALSLAAIGLWSAGAGVVTFNTIYFAALVYLPAMWIMIGLAVLFIGFAPKYSGLAWMYLLYSFIVVYLGRLLQFPEWMSNLSPYGHVPQLPVEDMDVTSISTLSVIAIVLSLIGFVFYNKRDLYG